MKENLKEIGLGFNWKGKPVIGNPIGSKLKITTDSGFQVAWVNPAASYLASNDLRVLFGLGTDEIVTSLEIEWPGFGKDLFENLTCNSYYGVCAGRIIINNQLLIFTFLLSSFGYPQQSVEEGFKLIETRSYNEAFKGIYCNFSKGFPVILKP
ncbi:MAG: hypothetical protein Ct9H300mP18_10150 [Candidatus Neomarinimicrobiota bacterium]|nr:MAG: hypothetical protein Ct9H300mP18_10150 [Candidatus Neomarinimicrobiota bacterium]